MYQAFGDIEKLPWIGLGFPMASVAVILFVGRLYGLFNVKWLILTFIFLFEVGSAVCGSAPSLNALIVGRAIAGIGGAGMYLGYVLEEASSPFLFSFEFLVWQKIADCPPFDKGAHLYLCLFCHP